MKFFVGTMTAKPGKRDEFLVLIRAHAVNTRREPGCVYFEVEPMLDRPNECAACRMLPQRRGASPP